MVTEVIGIYINALGRTHDAIHVHQSTFYKSLVQKE
jgi:hypothetical protein